MNPRARAALHRLIRELDRSENMHIDLFIHGESEEPGAPIFNRYPGQHQPQPGVIEIDPDVREVEVFSDPEIGNAVPEAVYHGRRLRVDCSPYVSAEGVRKWFEENRALFERVISGWSEHLNDQLNHSGRLTEDAGEAMSQLEWSAREIQESQVWEPEEWLFHDSDLYNFEDARKEVDEIGIDEYAKQCVAIASSDGIVIAGGRDALKEMVADALRKHDA